MVRSVVGLLRVNPGLDPQNVLRVYPRMPSQHPDPDPRLTQYQYQSAALAFFADAQSRVAAVPGVTAAGVGFEGPLDLEVSTSPGRPPLRVMNFWTGVGEADPLRVLRVPLKQGRWLDRGDVGQPVRRVLVNETAARQLWAEGNALGKRFWWRDREGVQKTFEVVGVVGDTRDYTDYVEPQPTFYRVLQRDVNMELAPMFLVIRASVNPGTLYAPIARALKAAGAAPGQPMFFINLGEALRTAMAGHRTVMRYVSIFAGVGLLLAVLGLYGVLAYSVARRTHEIGIRMALGAQTADVLRLVMGQGLRLVAAGTVLGLAAALATGRVLRAYLFGVSSTDPGTLMAVALLLAAVALLACWLPARKAARVEPMAALRYE
jgi:putative ABC transport system permease protein